MLHNEAPMESCSNCGTETENEPVSLCDACEREDREAIASRLNHYRDALHRIYRAYEAGETHPIIFAEIAAEALGIPTAPPTF